MALIMDRLAEAAGTLRTSLLTIDVDRGTCRQHWYPKQDVANGPAYALFVASNSRFYTSFGSQFVEFDIDAQSWRFAQKVGTAMSFAEGPDGTIYFAVHPSSTLYAYDPHACHVREVARLDPVEKYPSFLAVDEAGWVYAGVGTAHSNLVACDPRTGEVRSLAAPQDRRVGSGFVYIGEDNQVYGRASTNGTTYRLFEGQAHSVNPAPPAAAVGGISWSKMHSDFPDGSRISLFDVSDGRAEVLEADGRTTELNVSYHSDGTDITCLVGGPDGRVYGSTAHPMHFFSLDPDLGKVEDWGHIARIGGGNFPAMAVQQGVIYGAAYQGGYLYRYDPSRPWNPSEETPDPNPQVVTEFRGPISRPGRCWLTRTGGESSWAASRITGWSAAGWVFTMSPPARLDLFPTKRCCPVTA